MCISFLMSPRTLFLVSWHISFVVFRAFSQNVPFDGEQTSELQMGYLGHGSVLCFIPEKHLKQIRGFIHLISIHRTFTMPQTQCWVL